MELRNIKTFIYAADTGSFMQAAEALGYARSSVTVQLQQLENELGQPLFDRIGHSVSLTDFGRSFLPLARQMLNLSEQMSTLTVDPQELHTTIRIGIVESLFASRFLNQIPLYQEKYPNVMLDFTTAGTSDICEMVSRNELDIGFCLSEDQPPANLHCHFCEKTPVQFIAGAKSNLPRDKRIPLQCLEEEHFVLSELNCIHDRVLSEICRTHGIMINPAVRLSSTHCIVDVLLHNGGVSFLPRYATNAEVKAGHLRVIDTDVPTSYVNVIVLTHPQKWISPYLGTLIELFQHEPWL